MVITKILASKLHEFYPKVISEEKDDFIREKYIGDGIIIMNEVIHSINYKIK